MVGSHHSFGCNFDQVAYLSMPAIDEMKATTSGLFLDSESTRTVEKVCFIFSCGMGRRSGQSWRIAITTRARHMNDGGKTRHIVSLQLETIHRNITWMQWSRRKLRAIVAHCAPVLIYHASRVWKHN